MIGQSNIGTSTLEILKGEYASGTRRLYLWDLWL